MTRILAAAAPDISWRQLPPLPDPCGFASPFVGTADKTLLVAGGANFPGPQMWEGGVKTWHDRVFALTPDASAWKLAGKLPAPCAYGVTISLDDGLLLIGGSDAQRCSAETRLMFWRNGRLEFKSLPPLPRPVAMAAGARVGNSVYVAGGVESPDQKHRLTSFYVLDLSDMVAGWRSLPSWPGPGRSQAVAAAAGGYFYLFSGIGGVGGEPEIYLSDAYRYSPGGNWERLPDLPHAAAAAASPAPVSGNAVIFLVGGVDGSDRGTRPQDFRVTPQRIQLYDASSRRWSDAGNAPVGRVCVSTTQWEGAWVLPTGERSAGIRSPEVWGATIQSPKVAK